MPNIMPGFDREIAKLAQRLLINGRPIDYHTNVIASKVTPGARAYRTLGSLLPGWLMGAVCWAPASSAPADWSTKQCTHRRAAAWRMQSPTPSPSSPSAAPPCRRAGREAGAH